MYMCIRVLAIVANQHRINRILNSNCWAIAEENNREQERKNEKKKRKIIMGDKLQAGCRYSAIFSLYENIYAYERLDI